MEAVVRNTLGNNKPTPPSTVPEQTHGRHILRRQLHAQRAVEDLRPRSPRAVPRTEVQAVGANALSK